MIPYIISMMSSVRMFDTSLANIVNGKQHRQQQRFSVLSNTGRQFLSSSSRSGRDNFQEGMNILARSERDSRNSDNVDDKEFNLFEDIPEQQIEFRTGLPIMVEVISFGPLGASVAVIGKGSHDAATVKLSDTSNPLAIGLIYQNEIRFYREARRNVDVVLGEILPAYVERVRDDGKIDVSLRVIGGRAKVDKWSGDVLKRLEELGEIPLGNKSTPVEVAREFPGMSKSDFKKCIGSLFERKLVFPFPYAVLSYEEGLAIDTAQCAEEMKLEDGLESSTGSAVNASTGPASDYSNINNDDNNIYNSSSDNTRNRNNDYRPSRPNDDGYRNNNRN